MTAPQHSTAEPPHTAGAWERGPAQGVATAPEVSVIVATYNRTESVARLLDLLSDQTLPPDRYEVVVVDDGSRVPAAPTLEALRLPYRLVVKTQENGGPAAARHTGIQAARGRIVVSVDDDMRVGRDFLEAHLEEHAGDARRVVLGRLVPEPGTPLRLHERFQLRQIDLVAEAVGTGIRRGRGTDLYTGNVSFRRDDYLLVGGFDPSFRLSEDAELGVRLDRSGVEFAISERARAQHASDHASVAAWMRRAQAYAVADSRMAAKHGDPRDLNPWRFLFLVNPVSRPMLIASVRAPRFMRGVARTVMGLAEGLARLRLERAAIAGTTLAYGMCYFTGVREAAGSWRVALAGLRRHLNQCPGPELGVFARTAKCLADARADHEAIHRSGAKYNSARRQSGMLSDFMEKIGFQMMVAYRVMRLLRDVRLTLLAKLASRAIRHLYAAELHWDADFAPGVVIVHGTGLVVSHAARVGPGCILFQHVTLGESIHPERREIGAPTLEADVHVGPGATLLGPITIGRGSKVTASALVMRDVPPMSLVETPMPTVRPRGGRVVRAAAGGEACGDETGRSD